MYHNTKMITIRILLYTLLLVAGGYNLSATTDDNLSATPVIEIIYSTEEAAGKDLGIICNDSYAVLLNPDKTAIGYQVTDSSSDTLLGYTELAISSSATEASSTDVGYKARYGIAMNSEDFINELQAATEIVLDTQMSYYILQNIVHDQPNAGYYILVHASTAVEYDSEISYLGQYQNESGVVYFVYGQPVPESRYRHVAKEIMHHEIVDAKTSAT
jgi:hypothetical protein